MTSRRRYPVALLAAVATVAVAAGQAPAQEPQGKPGNSTLIVGIDVSGSFKSQYDDAIEFASYYIYAHLHGLGGLRAPTALFVSSIGGERPGEPKAFHPIDDFANSSREQIASDLRGWFPPRDAFTDFNTFFKQVAMLAKERGLILAPMSVVVLSDGTPDLPGSMQPAKSDNAIARIDFGSLEFVSRSVTVRLLYASPTIGDAWKRMIRRKRVRLWTQDAPVMVGWHRQLRPDQPLDRQANLWKWVQDNVDFRVRAGNLF
ncbi:MAG TPA: hypothetical protein VIW28_03745 [Gemmatimonadales bacterium]